LKPESGGALDDSTRGFDGWWFLEETGGGDSGEGGLKVAKGQKSRLLKFKGRGIWVVDIESRDVEMEAKRAILLKKATERERVY
jgi:hypothetical protein